MFHAIHDVAHPGIRATRRMLSARFVWKGVGKDVAAMCRPCQQCQRGKVHKQPTAPVQAIPVPARKFSHVHVDLVGPLPASSEGHVYRPSSQDVGRSFYPACAFMKPQTGGGAHVEDRI